MKTWLTSLFAAIFSNFLAIQASAEADNVPFVAVDVVNGHFFESVKNELERSNVSYKSLTSPITSQQLEGAKILLICDNFRRRANELNLEPEGLIYTNEEISAIANYVKNGGILIGAGLSWTWAQYSKRAEKFFPLNQIGEALGFTFYGVRGLDGYENELLNLVPGLPPPTGGGAFSELKFDGSFDNLIRLRGRGPEESSSGGGGAKRENGHIYLFGHTNFIQGIPEVITAIYQGASVNGLPATINSELETLEKLRRTELAAALKPLADLTGSYLNALKRAREAALAAGDLKKILAADEEIKRLEAGDELVGEILNAEIESLRNTYTKHRAIRTIEALAKMAEVERSHTDSLQVIVRNLTQAGMLEEAKRVHDIEQAVRESIKELSGKIPDVAREFNP